MPDFGDCPAVNQIGRAKTFDEDVVIPLPPSAITAKRRSGNSVTSMGMQACATMMSQEFSSGRAHWRTANAEAVGGEGVKFGPEIMRKGDRRRRGVPKEYSV